MSDDKKDARLGAMLESLRGGATLEQACAVVGVSSRTIRRWREADAELDDAVADAMCLVDDLVEAVTYRNCLDPDPAHNTLRMFWLKNRRREVFGEKIQQDITSGGRPLRPTLVEVIEPAGARVADDPA